MMIIVTVAGVLAMLRGPLAGNASVAEAGLWIIWNLAVKDNSRMLGTAGACEGE